MRTEDGGKTWERATIPSGAKPDLWAVVFAGASSAVAVGDDGTILRTRDWGKTWEPATIVSGIAAHLRAVAFTNATSGIAVGGSGTILHTNDGGKSWERATTPPAGVGDLKAVVFRGPQIGIAVGKGETILRTEDGGKSWQGTTTPPGSKVDLLAVAFTSATTAVATGTEAGRLSMSDFGSEQPILHTEDGGKSWTRATMPPGIAANLRAVVFTGGTTAIAGGDGANVWHSEDNTASSASGFGAAILWTEDRGRSWKRLATPSGAGHLQSLVFISDLAGVAVGESGTILHTEDGGKNWGQATIPSGSGIQFRAVVFADAASGIAIGDTGIIVWTEDGGKSWERARTPPGIESDALQTVVLTSPTTGVAIGESGAILRTEDGGKRWERARILSRVTSDLRAAAFTGALIGVAVGNDGTILQTADGGKTWEGAKIPSGAKSNLQAVVFTGASNGVAVGDDGTILHTDDGGKTWERATIPPGIVAHLGAVAFAGATSGIAVGDSGTILRTENGGKTWERAPTPSGFAANLFAAVFTTATNGIAVGDNIIRTEDSGKSWKLATMPSGPVGRFQAVAFAGASTGVAIGNSLTVSGGQTGNILWTDDGGKSWDRAKAPSGADLADVDLHSVVFAGESTGITVGRGGTILATRDNGKTWTRAAVLSPADNINLLHVAIDRPTGLGIIVGSRGTRITTDGRNYSAYLNHPESSVRQSLGGRIELDLQTVDDEGDAARILAVEYNVVRKDRKPDWKPLPSVPTKSNADGHWRSTWLPSDDLISNGATIEHRVFLDDGGPPLAAIVLDPIVFRSLWDRASDYQGTLWTAVGIATLIAVYLLPICFLFWIAPARLALAGSGTLDAVGTAAEGGTAWSKAISTLLRQLALPWFKRRLRVRHAWLAAYCGGTTQFDKLAKEVREQFLEQDDVLDAWGARRLLAVREALAQLPLYRSRRTYIPVPVRVGDAATGETLDQPGPSSFQHMFERDRVILSIVGVAAVARPPSPALWRAGQWRTKARDGCSRNR